MAAPICTVSQLTAALGNPSGTAGSVYYDLELTNTSSSTCTIDGYAGVSFVAGSDDRQVGAAAVKQTGADSGTVAPIELTSGQAAWETVQITVADNYPASTCQPTAVSGLRVYPPGDYSSMIVSHSDQGCDSTSVHLLHIDPFAAAGAATPS